MHFCLVFYIICCRFVKRFDQVWKGAIVSIVYNSVLNIFKLYEIAIFDFCLAKIEIAQKVANWRLLSRQLATFLLKTKI